MSKLRKSSLYVCLIQGEGFVFVGVLRLGRAWVKVVWCAFMGWVVMVKVGRFFFQRIIMKKTLFLIERRSFFYRCMKNSSYQTRKEYMVQILLIRLGVPDLWDSK